MSEWNFMDPGSKNNLLRTVKHEANKLFTMVEPSEVWESPTGAGHWQVRDVIGHLVDTTESYFVAFDAARGRGEAAEPLGLVGMAKYVDDGAQAFRGTPQDELLFRLRGDFDRMLGIFDDLSDNEWSTFQVPHKYMGPLPVPFYPIFQLVDYAMHGWDIREGSGRAHVMSAEAADLLVPLGFILWQATAQCQPDDEAYSVGVRITSGHNAGATRLDVSPDGVAFEPASLDGVPTVLEFDPASFILTAYGRINAGAVRGDIRQAERFLNLCFRI
ncbi:MAG TPA: maleylpyruvate isomerase family mycothiol-dependent enzyme [Nocardioidaceae bacterium]|nr:maleylpyruvate isomerase family mycothiol-dependent enzyme [Nocardioidaceae bacterium]